MMKKRHIISQGTVSWFIGCHSIGHSILVYISWVKLYHQVPGFRETVCIFIHDIGHIGKNYLDDEQQKRDHWILGARIAGKLFGQQYYALVAGHDRYSGYPESALYKPDKYSWYIAPFWWIYLNNIIEPGIKAGMKNMEACREFKAKVKQSIESGEFRPSHDMYLERINGKKDNK